jgi:hypothetical protein
MKVTQKGDLQAVGNYMKQHIKNVSWGSSLRELPFMLLIASCNQVSVILPGYAPFHSVSWHQYSPR